jgi:hypothetical protein
VSICFPVTPNSRLRRPQVETHRRLEWTSISRCCANKPCGAPRERRCRNNGQAADGSTWPALRRRILTNITGLGEPVRGRTRGPIPIFSRAPPGPRISWRSETPKVRIPRPAPRTTPKDRIFCGPSSFGAYLTDSPLLPVTRPAVRPGIRTRSFSQQPRPGGTTHVHGPTNISLFKTYISHSVIRLTTWWEQMPKYYGCDGRACQADDGR